MSEDRAKDVVEIFEGVKGKIVCERDLHDNFNRLAKEKLSFLERLYLNQVEMMVCAGLSIAQGFNYFCLGKRIEEPYYSMIGDGSSGIYVRKTEADSPKTNECFIHVARDIKGSTTLAKILPFKLQRKITHLTAEAYEACRDYRPWKEQGHFVPHRADPDLDKYSQDGAAPE